MFSFVSNLLVKIIATLLLATVVLFNQNIKDHYYRNTVGDNVVRIYDINKSIGSGTGFHIKDEFGNIFILTNKHVCEVADRNDQLLVEKDGVEIPRKVIERYENHDLCLIEGLPGHTNYIKISDEANFGEDVVLIGHPGGRPLTLSHGELIGEREISLGTQIVSPEECKDGEVLDVLIALICIEKMPGSQISTPSYGGNSGSPVVDKYGNLVGVLFAGNRTQVNDSFMVPLRFIKDFIKGN